MPPLECDEEVKIDPEETTAERVKLIPRKRKNISTNKSWKQFINIKLWSRTNTASFVSAH